MQGVNCRRTRGVNHRLGAVNRRYAACSAVCDAGRKKSDCHSPGPGERACGARLSAMTSGRLSGDLGEVSLTLFSEPWLSGCQVLSGDLSGCQAAVRHCQVSLSDQLSGAVSAVRRCQVCV